MNSPSRDRSLQYSPTPAAAPVARWWSSVPYPGMLVGIAVFAALLAFHGIDEVMADLVVAGWGLLVVTAYHLTSLAADAIAWRGLLEARERPSLLVVGVARWIGESVNALLPVMQLGGNIVRAQYVARRGVPGTSAGASVVIDITLEVLTQFVFALLGVALLVGDAGGKRLLLPVLLGTGVMGLLVTAFVVAQRAGLFGAAVGALRRVGAADRFVSLGEQAAGLDARIVTLYDDRRALLSSSAWHLLGWVLGAGEVWLALYFLGHPISIASAIVLESLGAAVRAAAFAVPGALGIQEGGFVVLGGVLGLSPETCLALSLSKRAREILLGLPGLVVWQLGGDRASNQKSPSD